MKYIACFIMLAMQASALHLNSNFSTDSGSDPFMWKQTCYINMDNARREVDRPLSCYFTDCEGFYIGEHEASARTDKLKRLFWSKKSVWTQPIGANYRKMSFEEGEAEFCHWGEREHNHLAKYVEATQFMHDPYEGTGGFDREHPKSMMYYMLKLAAMFHRSGYALYMDWCDEPISAMNKAYHDKWDYNGVKAKWGPEHYKDVELGLMRAVRLTKVFILTYEKGTESAGCTSPFCKAEEVAVRSHHGKEIHTMQMPDINQINAALVEGSLDSYVPNVRYFYEYIGQNTKPPLQL